MGDDPRRTAALGILIGVAGLLCLGGGVALLIWRLVQPDRSLILPPGAVLEVTPTPGLLGSPLPPPALPDTALVILPANERPTDEHPTDSPTEQPSYPTKTRTPRQPTITQFHTTTAPRPTTAPILTAPRPSLTPTPLSLTATQTTVPPTVAPTTTPNIKPAVAPAVAPATAPDIPDRIIIPTIRLDAPIIPVGQHALHIGEHVYSQWDVPGLYAAGWHESSAPLGKAGNTVINGHHNAYGEVFRYLIAVQPGNTLLLEAKGRRYTYIIVQTMVLSEENETLEVRRENARWILPTADERVTLITCWPYTGRSHRLIVIAMPIASPERPSNMP